MHKIFNDKTKIYWIYAILFILTACIVFSVFIINKRSFVWQDDGLKQHYIILKDFNEKVRDFLSNPSEGLDLFSWNMGLGLDVIGQYSYYVLGDPFAYISLLFPMQHLEMTYNLLIILRLFCIGIAFITYSKYHLQKSENAEKKFYNILIGALIYTFSAYSIYAGVRHPYFLNAMILFPLLLLGVDKLFRENKKIPFIIFIALSAISNYYFFYMHTIMIVIYAIIQYICEYRKEGAKHFFKKLGSAILCYVIGILIAGIILMPTIHSFINSARSGEKTLCQYNEEYYQNIFTINLLTVNDNNWSAIGVSSIILLMLPVLWLRKKEHKIYLIYFLVTTIMLLMPFIGSLMNGFSFPSNRWSFMYSFILAYIVMSCLEENYTKKELISMGAFYALYSIIGISIVLISKMRTSVQMLYFIQIVIALLMYIVIVLKNNRKISFWLKCRANIFKIIILLLVISNIGIMSYGLYSSFDREYAKEFIKLGQVEEKIKTQRGKNQDYSQNIQEVLEKDKEFYRISKLPHELANYSIYYNYPSIECFLSLGSKYVYNLSRELADNKYSTTMNVRGFADRTKITSLLGNKYYVVDEKNQKYVPYGYTLLQEKEGKKIYQNKYPLSIGVCYNNYMLKENYEKLNPIEKEDAILKVAVVDSKEEIKDVKLKEKKDIRDIRDCYQNIPYRLIDKENIVTQKENRKQVVTKKDKQSIEIEIDNIENSELYVYISGFEFMDTKKHTVTAKFKNKMASRVINNKITSPYYQKVPEILLNLGYYDNAEGKIELTFSTKGVYCFKDIQVVAVSMDNYENTIQRLQQNELKELKCINREISGKINLSEDAVLQITSSYTTGWKAYVDGERVDTINVNTAFIGIPVKAGQHEIYLTYEVPYLKLGIICTSIGVVAFIVVAVLEKRRIEKY